MTIAEIVANIDQRLADLDAELAHLTGARDALMDQAQPAPRPAARRRRTAPAPAERSFDVVPVGKLLTLLTGSGPMRTRELSDATNGDPAQILALLKEQEGAGEVRRTGSAAGTRWRAVTDEDRIAVRVAELEATSRAGRARRT